MRGSTCCGFVLVRLVYTSNVIVINIIIVIVTIILIHFVLVTIVLIVLLVRTRASARASMSSLANEFAAA